MRGSGRDQMGEAFEGYRIAVMQVLRDSLFQRQELDHHGGSRDAKKFVLRT